MKFKSMVFEKLLFPLHRQAYRQIQEILDEVEQKRPGQLRRILDGFAKAAFTDTQTTTWMPGKADEARYPTLDIFILFSKNEDRKISSLHKSADYKISFNYDEKTPDRFTGSHLILNYYQNSAPKTYIVPLEYLLGYNEETVLKDGSYQLYSHTILSPEKSEAINSNFKNRLWAEDLDFRIKSTTGQKNRFSFRQIQAANYQKGVTLDPVKKVCQGSGLLVKNMIKINNDTLRAGFTKVSGHLIFREGQRLPLRAAYASISQNLPPLRW